MKYIVLMLLALIILLLGCADPIQLKSSQADRLADAGKYGEAITVYQEIYGAKPSDEIKSKLASTYAKRADLYFVSDNFTNAIADYNEALLYDSSMDLTKQISKAYYKRGLTFLKPEIQYLGLWSNYDPKCEDNPSRKDQIPMAISDFSAAIELNPLYKDALHDRGYAYVIIGDYDKALLDLDKVIEIDPVSKRAFLSKAVALAGQGHFDLAIQTVSKSIEIDKDYIDAYFARAQGYSEYMTRYAEAVDDYSTVINLTVEQDRIWQLAKNNIAVIYISDLDQPGKAIDELNALIKVIPNEPLAYYNRGWAYYGTRMYQESLADFQKYLSLDVGDCYRLRDAANGHINRLNLILSGAIH